MTGPGEGKVKLEAEVLLALRSGIESRLNGAEVYVHVKGYSLARVTHLDIEHPSLNAFIPPSGGKYLRVKGIDGGLQVFQGKTYVKVLNPELNRILSNGEATITWVGGKLGGIYIGFKKEHIRKLEDIASQYGVIPR